MSVRKRYDSIPTPIWLAFLLPGQLVALAQYYFAKPSEVWTSARRADGTFFHAMYSISFWIILAIAVYGLIKH